MKPQHRVSLPPIGIPLVCKEGRLIKTVQPWSSFTEIGKHTPNWKWMSPGDIVLCISQNYYQPARFDTHDWWKLTFLHKGERVSYLWNSHTIFVPSGRALNNWVDYWEPLEEVLKVNVEMENNRDKE